MGALSTPPTYAPFLVEGPDGKVNAISPVWLQWFLQYGQQANVNSNTLGTGQYTDVTANRTIGTVEILTASQSINVIASVQVPTGAVASLDVYVPPVVPHGTTYSLAYFLNQTGSTRQYVVAGRVPIQWGYTVNILNGTGSLNYWLEW